MSYKKYIDKDHYVRESMGDDFMNGISEGIQVGKMLGLDKQVEKDFKRLKGYNDAEISEMDLATLRKECNRYHTRFIVLTVCAVILIPTIILGILAGVIAYRDFNQYKKLKAKIDEYYK